MKDLLITEENKSMLPIEYFSSSSIQEFITNPYSFFTKYVLYDWEDKKGVALFIGTACHAALEYYYNEKAIVLENRKKENIYNTKDFEKFKNKLSILKENPQDNKEEIKKLENIFKNIKLPDQEQIQNLAMAKFIKLIWYQEKKGLEELAEKKKFDFKTFFEHYQDLEIKPEIIKELEAEIEKLTEIAEIAELPPEDFEKINNDIIEKNTSITKLKDYIIRAEGFYKSHWITAEKLEYYKALYIDYWVIKTTITDKKEKVINDSYKKILIAINNYFDAINAGIIPDYKPLGTEIKVIGSIENIPVPLKWSMDLIAYEEKETEAYPIDHKFVSQPTLPEVPEITITLENGKIVKLPNLPAGYIIQAGTYRIIAKEFLGYKPKKVIYDEVLKSIANPASGLVKKDLVKLLEENQEKIEEINKTREEKIAWNSKTKNEDMVEILVELEILKKPTMVNRVIIDFEKYPELDQIFLELYKRVLNQIWVMSIYDLPLDFLPNFKADFSGAGSWTSFQKLALEGKNWKAAALSNSPEVEEIKKVDF